MRPIPCFHPIPPGYGLPGARRRRKTFPIAGAGNRNGAGPHQLKTQTPAYQKEPPAAVPARRPTVDDNAVRLCHGQSPSLPSAADAATDARCSQNLRMQTAGSAASIAPAASMQGIAVAPAIQAPDARKHFGRSERSASSACRRAGLGRFAARLARSERLGAAAAVVRSSGMPSVGRAGAAAHADVSRQRPGIYGRACKTTPLSATTHDLAVGPPILQRSDDFIRFCCHKHIAEMLTARGGAGETRVLLRWSEGRYIP